MSTSDTQSLQPRRPTGTTNELAKERNRAAAERTLNSWIGRCIGLIGTGLAFDQLVESLREQFSGRPVLTSIGFAHLFGMVFVGTGLILLSVALLEHCLAVKTIEREDYVALSVTALNRIAVAAILLLGFMGFFVVVFSL